MKYYSYEEFVKDSKLLSTEARELNVDGFVGILRGGATLAHFLCEGVDSKNMYTIRASSYHGQNKNGKPVVSNIPELGSEKVVAIVDEIVDSGETMKYILDEFCTIYPDKKFVTIAIFQKPSAIIKADIFAHETYEWIDFFWEADMREVKDV
jgi:xanthine phosphoribosyltransferase